VRGTFFFLGWVAQKFPWLVREAVQLEHEIACHSYWHRLVYRLTPEGFREDTRRAKESIEQAAGREVLGYRAPSFSMIKGTEWAMEILGELGFRYDSSVFPIKHDVYSNESAPRIPHLVVGESLWEFPLATFAVARRNFPVAGGGYLRILPYGYTQWGLQHINGTEKLPAVMYIHPWELDPEQPRLKSSVRSRFRQYTGLKTAAEKLECLLRDFRFAPMTETFSAELHSHMNRSTTLVNRETDVIRT
jgi:polysaccharide deacetylase family protein (PEP-CTERM system associated)